MNKKEIFVVRVNNYWPELCEFTIPTIKNWAEKNGWKYSEITERKFDGLPFTAEKLQIHELGSDNDWSAICDADLMLRPDFLDPSKILSPFEVASSYRFDARDKFAGIEDDGRNIGISGGFVVTSRLTHELWKNPSDWESALKSTSANPHLIDEQVIANNLARLKYPFNGVSEEPDTYIVHFGGTNDKKTYYEKQAEVVRAKDLWLNWCLIWPELSNHAQKS